MVPPSAVAVSVDRRIGRRGAFELRELPLCQQATLLIAVNGFESRLNLKLTALHTLEVGIDLGWQLAGVTPAVLLHVSVRSR